MTTEAQKTQQEALNRYKEVDELARNQGTPVPSRKTYLSESQCRLGEQLFRTVSNRQQDDERTIRAAVRFLEEYDAETLEIAREVVSAAGNKKNVAELRDFAKRFYANDPRCTPITLLDRAAEMGWANQSFEKPSVIEGLMAAIRFVEDRAGRARVEHLLTAAFYIAGRFQPDPTVYVPVSVLDNDYEVRNWCLYDPEEELQKWDVERAKVEEQNRIARQNGEPLLKEPKQPKQIVEYRYKPHPMKPGAFYLAPSERPRPWTYSQAKTMIDEVRYLRRIMSSSTLNGKPARWCTPPGKDLIMPTKGVWGNRRIQELTQSRLEKRVLTEEEKQRLLVQ